MSLSDTPRRETTGGGEGSTRRPEGRDPQFYSALGRVTIAAIEREVQREELARKAYLSQIREAFAPSAAASGFSHGLDAAAVRASAQREAGDAGSPGSAPRRRLSVDSSGLPAAPTKEGDDAHLNNRTGNADA